MKMAANQVLSCAAKVSFIRNRGDLSLAGSGFFIPVAAAARITRWSSAVTKFQHRIPDVEGMDVRELS